jgi:hypothetical protein
MKKGKFQHPKKLGDRIYLFCRDAHLYLFSIALPAYLFLKMINN